MAFRRTGFVGLAIDDRGISAAEVCVSAKRARLRRAGEFVFPEGASFDDPQRLGRLLGEFLRREGFAAGSAIIGVPARWLLSREREFPAAGPDALAGMVRLEAERSFAMGFDSLAVDYAEGCVGEKGQRLTIAAMARKRLNEVLAVARAGGLSVRAVVPAAMVLATASQPEAGLTLVVRPGCAEAVMRSGGRCGWLRYLSVAAPEAESADSCAGWTARLADAASHVAALGPAAGGCVEGPLVVWDGVGLPAGSVDALGKALSAPSAAVAGMAGLGLELDGARREGLERFAAAAALALAGMGARALPADFVHSKLERRKATGLGRRVAWGAAVGVAVLAALGFYLAAWRGEERDLADLRERLASMQDDIAAARSVVETVELTRGWTDKRPRFLEPLRELTLAFPEDGRIYVTNMAVRQDMRVLISGMASDERTVLDLLDGIRAKDAFAGVKLVYLRDAGGGAGEVAFSITFSFVGGV